MAQNTKRIDSEENVNFADIEPLLRKSLNCPQLQVVEYTATKLVPIGENYSSILVKINAKIRRSQDAQEERLYLAAKTINRVPRPILDWALSIKKEIFAYHELLPVYKDLEREVGIAENELIDILPKYIGHRYSLDENSEVLDDDSLLLMENIKTQGYYNGNRHIGLDIHHAKKALTAVARYHALGVTLKQKRPDFFTKAVTQARVLGIDFDQLYEGFDALFNDFRRDSSLVGKHLPLLESNYEDFKNGNKSFTVSTDETWSTVTHGDFWVNNMLFHKDDHGNIDDVKLIDFQVLLFNSALKDLPYFLTGSLDDTTINHIDELIDIHYNTFIRTLERMGIETKVFTRESYDMEMKKQAINEFPLCALAQKFFVHEVNAEEKMDGLMAKIFESEISDVFRKRVARLVHTYEKKGWF